MRAADANTVRLLSLFISTNERSRTIFRRTKNVRKQ